MMSQSNAGSGRRVEVSGWDVNENFFVEKAELKCVDEQQKRVALRNPVRSGALVFVRRLDADDSGAGFPVAYKADAVVPHSTEKQYEIFLVRMWPRGRQNFIAC